MWISWMIQCLFKRICLCCFLHVDFAYEMMRLNEDIILFIATWEQFITIILPWSEFILFLDVFCTRMICQPARRPVMLEKKYTIRCIDNTNFSLKERMTKKKIKQVVKRFFAKTSSWNPFQAYQLGLRIIYSSCNTKYDKGKHTACFSIHSKRKCFSLSQNKSTRYIVLLLSTLYRQNPLIQGINSSATLDYYISSTVTDFKKKLSQISFWI